MIQPPLVFLDDLCIGTASALDFLICTFGGKYSGFTLVYFSGSFFSSGSIDNVLVFIVMLIKYQGRLILLLRSLD